MPKRIALNANGLKYDRAPLTAVKFKPQIILIATNNKSSDENLDLVAVFKSSYLFIGLMLSKLPYICIVDSYNGFVKKILRPFCLIDQ